MKNLILLFCVVAASAAFAGPKNWTYYEGQSMNIEHGSGWKKLNGACGGEVKLTTITESGLFGSVYNAFMIYNSKCDGYKSGLRYNNSNGNFEVGPSTKSVPYSYQMAVNDSTWGTNSYMVVPLVNYFETVDGNGGKYFNVVLTGYGNQEYQKLEGWIKDNDVEYRYIPLQ